MTPTEREELNEYLAVHVRGWHVEKLVDQYGLLAQAWCNSAGELCCWVCNWRPTTKANQALEVEEAMRGKGWITTVCFPFPANPVFVADMLTLGRNFGAEADTFQEALCMAARAAVEDKKAGV